MLTVADVRRRPCASVIPIAGVVAHSTRTGIKPVAGAVAHSGPGSQEITGDCVVAGAVANAAAIGFPGENVKFCTLTKKNEKKLDTVRRQGVG
jgi:hypothetical protein